jgi:hypothetical protein
MRYNVILLCTLEILEHTVTRLVEATNRKDVGSISVGVIGIFHCNNPSGRTMALGSIQTPTEVSIGNISWG